MRRRDAIEQPHGICVKLGAGVLGVNHRKVRTGVLSGDTLAFDGAKLYGERGALSYELFAAQWRWRMVRRC